MYFCMKTFLSKHQKIFRAYSSFNIHHDPKNTAFFSDGNQCLSSKQGHCQLTVLRILLYCCSENASWSNTVSAGKKNQTLQWDLSLKQKGVVENSSLTYCCGLSCPFCSRIPRFLGNAFISNIAAYSFKKEKISWGMTCTSVAEIYFELCLTRTHSNASSLSTKQHSQSSLLSPLNRKLGASV